MLAGLRGEDTIAELCRSLPGRQAQRRREGASEKLEIIRLVEQSHLPTKQTIDRLGIPRTTFYRWYDRYLTGGVEALEDRSPQATARLEPHS